MKTVNRLNKAMFAALACVVLIGCGEASPYVPASGTVKYDDGTVPQGDIASITFQPKTSGPGTKGAQGSIKPDGSFELHTLRQGDGVKPGAYIVTVNVMLGFSGGNSVIPVKYSKARETPLSAEIEANGENRFEFIIEKSAGTEKP